MYNNNRSRSSFSRGPRPQFGGGGRGGSRGGNRSRFRSASFDPSMLIKKAEYVEEPIYQATHQFSDFAFSEHLQHNIQSRGYTSPTPIQDQAIDTILEGRDVVGIANTGTGKTAAFLLPLIEKITKNPEDRALIIAPTRELAVQIRDELRAFTQGMGIFSVLCIGGVSMYNQIDGLRRPHQFVIGTPGRIKDLEGQRKLHLDRYNNIVLDEVDRMLDMGFIHDVKHIASRLPEVRQSLFFSATMPPKVKEIMYLLLRDPVAFSVKTRETAANVDQDVIKTNGKPKVDVLHELLSQEGWDKVIVFGRTKWGMEKLANALDQRGFSVAAIHGNKTQSQRQRALDLFKKSKIQVLLATDIASRGIDVQDITHVVNFDLPESYEDYVHRIGRTGRANKKGVAISLIE